MPCSTFAYKYISTSEFTLQTQSTELSHVALLSCMSSICNFVYRKWINLILQEVKTAFLASISLLKDTQEIEECFFFFSLRRSQLSNRSKYGARFCKDLTQCICATMSCTAKKGTKGDKNCYIRERN